MLILTAFACLIAGFVSGTLTTSEKDELDLWVAASDRDLRLFEERTGEDKLEEAQAFFASKQARQQQPYAMRKVAMPELLLPTQHRCVIVQQQADRSSVLLVKSQAYTARIS